MNKYHVHPEYDNAEEFINKYLENVRQFLLETLRQGGMVTLMDQVVADPIREEFDGRQVVADVYRGHIFCAHAGVGEVTVSHFVN